MGKFEYIAYFTFYVVFTSLLTIFSVASGTETISAESQGIYDANTLLGSVLTLGGILANIPDFLIFIWNIMSLFAIVSVFMILNPFG